MFLKGKNKKKTQIYGKIHRSYSCLLPVSSSNVTQSTAANSKASTSEETKSSTNERPSGRATCSSASQGTAQITTQGASLLKHIFAKTNCQQWPKQVSEWVLIDCYLNQQSWGRVSHCCLHNATGVHWEGHELSGHSALNCMYIKSNTQQQVN